MQPVMAALIMLNQQVIVTDAALRVQLIKN
ncbi:hypothetical protein XMV208_000023 [Aliiroseovarius sp. xm-v-208]|nr:hypothetical protein [Aliiroseovarius sp. xm-v-208]